MSGRSAWCRCFLCHLPDEELGETIDPSLELDAIIDSPKTPEAPPDVSVDVEKPEAGPPLDVHAPEPEVEAPPLSGAPLAAIAEEVIEHLMDLRADLAWQELKRKGNGQPNLAAKLEEASSHRVPLQWLEAWGPVFDELWVTLLRGPLPPPNIPRAGEPANSPEWIPLCIEPGEDGIVGNIYARYLPKLHSVEMRSEIIMPGRYEDHFKGLAEVDLSAKLCHNVFVKGEGWRGVLPGNTLYWLVAKPPIFNAKMFWRDIVMHRQLVRCDGGVGAIEYSPTVFRAQGWNPPLASAERAKTYLSGGPWEKGFGGVPIPPCPVSGRDCSIGGSFVGPHTLADGSPGVCFRNCQIAEIHFPRWFPMPQRWYTLAAGFVQRHCQREITTTLGSDAGREEYEKRAAERPGWYKEEWMRGEPLEG